MIFFKKALNVGLICCLLAGASNDFRSWYFKRNGEGVPPSAQEEINLEQYSAYYLGDITQKELYLTFDEGYENGYTSDILDTLLELKVPAAFFVTKPYIDANPELIKRMVNEGHIVANHTDKHKSSPSLSPAELKEELLTTAKAFKDLTGLDMPKFFRPPMGQYSEQNLETIFEVGYSTIFWSFAYEDWITEKQPGAEKAYNTIIKHLHPGGILLLHAVSSSNTEALGDVIKTALELGYTFKSLNQLPNLLNIL